MTSIYERALGAEFGRLHPKLQWRFGFSSSDGTCQVGTGVMDDVWRGPWWTLPFLLLGSTRRVLFPSRGADVPFTIGNYAYVDGFGRETVTWARRFKLRRRFRAFDATMIFSEARGSIIDYLGTHQHLAVDLDLAVDDRAGLVLRSNAQRFYEGPIAFRFPMLLSGRAELHEWWSDEDQAFHVDLEVRNRWFGFLFGYTGTFTCAWVPASDAPAGLKPVRTERRT
jgi:hypothetical protein